MFDFSSWMSGDLPTPGIPESSTACPSPSLDFCQRSSNKLSSVERPTSGVRELACAASKRVAVCFGGKYPIYAKRFGRAFDFSKTKILKFKRSRCEPLRRLRYKQSVGRGERLQPRSNVRRLAYCLHPAPRTAGLTDHDSPRANPHP